MKNICFLIYFILLLPVISCKNEAAEIIVNDGSDKNEFIKLSEAQIQLANINVCEARDGLIGQQLTLTGIIRTDPENNFTVSARLKGKIEKLYFKNTGEAVRKGDKLFEFYSEELVDAQREYLNLQSNNWNFSGKYEPSLVLKDKLLVMGFMMSQIQQLEKERKILLRVTIHSPADGTIKSVNITEGQFVNEGESLFELADDDKLLVEALAYPNEARYITKGMQAIVIIPSAGKTAALCNVTFTNPSIQPGSNAILVRASLENKEKKLRAGMLAIMYVRIRVSHGLIIPASAVITGTDGERVWIEDENKNFLHRTITTGVQSGDSVQVLSGIVKTDKVVYTGAYLLDSEYKLRHGSTSVRKKYLPDFTVGESR